jgi:uncharacterized protein (TIGR02596 family)
MRKQAQGSLSAFSLIELLVVVAIIAVLLTLTSSGLGNLTSSLRIAQATEGVIGQFHLAKQRAMARNVNVEARIYQLPASGISLQAFRSVWLVEVDESRSNSTPLLRPFHLPDGVVFGENVALSSLMDLPLTNDANLTFPGYGNSLQYRAIRFYPNGSTALTNADGGAFLTCYSARTDADLSLASAPNNYATIQIVPQTGAVRVYRP